MKGPRRWHHWTLLPQTWPFYSSLQESRGEAEWNKVCERLVETHLRISQHISLEKVCSELKPKGIKLGTFQLVLLGTSSLPSWDPASLPGFPTGADETITSCPSQQPEGHSSLFSLIHTHKQSINRQDLKILPPLPSRLHPFGHPPLSLVWPWNSFLGCSRPRSLHSQRAVAVTSLKGRSA